VKSVKEQFMNFDEAIMKHAEWRMKLRTAMVRKEKLDAMAIGRDNNCELGKWLHGEGKTQAARLPSFDACVAEHRAFHAEAGKIASLINQGKYEEAEKLLAAGSEYSRISTSVGGRLIRLKHEISKAA
jgi:methyl-accepting chemotaxis protein